MSLDWWVDPLLDVYLPYLSNWMHIWNIWPSRIGSAVIMNSVSLLTFFSFVLPLFYSQSTAAVYRLWFNVSWLEHTTTISIEGMRSFLLLQYFKFCVTFFSLCAWMSWSGVQSFVDCRIFLDYWWDCVIFCLATGDLDWFPACKTSEL